MTLMIEPLDEDDNSQQMINFTINQVVQREYALGIKNKQEQSNVCREF